MSPSGVTGRVPARYLGRPARRVLEENPSLVEVWRVVGGTETRVAVFRSRLAPTGKGVAGRDRRKLVGDVSGQFLVMNAPIHADIQKDDEIWVGDARYRVISLDLFAHQRQVIVRKLQ